MLDYVAIGNQIRIKRKQKKWTQEKLAENVHISASFLGHIERGTRKMSLETAFNLSSTLELPMDTMFSTDFATKHIPPEIQRSAETFQRIYELVINSNE